MLVAYVFNQDFGANKEGDVVQLDPDAASALVDSGLISEADESHISGDDNADGDSPPVEDAAMVTRAVAGIKDSIQRGFADLAKHNRPDFSVAAEPKKEVFRNLGELCLNIYKSKQGDRTAINRLNAYQTDVRVKSPLGANETTNTQGGYFLKPTWYKTIWDKIRDYPKLLDRTDRTSITGNTFNINAINETGLADTQRHGGVLGYWLAEAASLTSTFPIQTQIQSVLNTNVVLVYATNQLLVDANIESFNTKMTELAGLELLWQENDTLVNGSGSQQPLGILNQPALVTVTHSTLDTNAMFGFDDLAKMYRSLYPQSRPNCCWLMNPEGYAALITQSFVTAGGTATTYPASGLSYNYMDQDFPLRIFGKPVIECLNLPQLGTVGDIILCDLKSALITAEHPEVFVDMSEHVQFTTLQTAFRFYRRYDIRSPWLTSLASKDGHYSYSPMVALSSRGT